MSALSRPAVLAWLLALAALVSHPALRAERWLPGQALLPVAVLLLALVGLLARAVAARGPGRPAAWLVAAGSVLALAGVGLDGLLGRQGTVTLGLGQTVGNFEETGPGGRSLGLRPLGFRIGADAETAAGVSLRLPQGTAELTGRRSVAVAGFRLADPRVAATGDVARLRVAVSDGTRTDVAELTPDGPARAGDLVLSLEQYFPDFALDEKQRPFTRSLEPRNPGALLTVARGSEVHRAFVLQSMPGVHRVAPLGLAFSLLDVQPERVATIGVRRQPFALVALLGGLLLIAGVAVGARARAGLLFTSATGDGPLVAGAALLACLLLVDSGRLLAWSLALAGPEGRLPLPGVGILLGLALIAALAGVLLLAAQRLASGVDVAAVAHGALGLAVIAAIAGAFLVLVRVPSSGVGLAATLPVAGMALAALVLAAVLRGPAWCRSPLVIPIATGLLIAVALGVGGWSTATHGGYATAATAAASAAALAGLAACETTGLAGLRRLALLVAALALLVRPF